jgi:hypothetical protein
MKELLLSKLSAVWYIHDSCNDDKSAIVERFNALPLLCSASLKSFNPDSLWDFICSEATGEGQCYEDLALDALWRAAIQDSIITGQLPADIFAFCESNTLDFTVFCEYCRALVIALRIDLDILEQGLLQQCYAEHCSPLKAVSFLDFIRAYPARRYTFRITVFEDEGDRDVISFYCLASDEDDAEELMHQQHSRGVIRHIEPLQLNDYPLEYILAPWRFQ